MSSISSILLVFVALLINFSSTAPSLLTRQTPQRYYLRTAAIPSDLTNTNDTGTLKNNLYITAYHVGAGFNNVGLTSNISEAVSGSLNSTIIDPNSGETTWISSLPPIISNGEPDYWDMCAVTSGDLNWGYMQINLGETSCNYFYAEGDLLVCAAGLWLACDWLDGLPQLFFISGDEAEVRRAPSSCSYVDLMMVPVDDC